MNIKIAQNEIIDMWLQFTLDSFGRHRPFAIVVVYADDTHSQLKFNRNIEIARILTELNKTTQTNNREELEKQIIEIANNI